MQFAVLIIALIASTVILPASGSPRRDKHVVCAGKVLKYMNSLCNQQTDIDFLKRKALECCRENCDIIEMFSFCARNGLSQESSEEKF